MKWDSYLLSQLSCLQHDHISDYYFSCLTIVSPFKVRSRLQFFGTDEHEPNLNQFCFYIRLLLYIIIIAVLKVFTVKNTKPCKYKKHKPTFKNMFEPISLHYFVVRMPHLEETVGMQDK